MTTDNNKVQIILMIPNARLVDIRQSRVLQTDLIDQSLRRVLLRLLVVDSEICGSVGTETGPVCNLSSKDVETLICLDLPGWKTQAFREMGQQDGGSRRGKTALIQL